jgi:hypothetical protein
MLAGLTGGIHCYDEIELLYAHKSFNDRLSATIKPRLMCTVTTKLSKNRTVRMHHVLYIRILSSDSEFAEGF